MKILQKIFGDESTKLIKQSQKTIDIINSLEQLYEALSDNELAAKTDYFKSELAKK